MDPVELWLNQDADLGSSWFRPCCTSFSEEKYGFSEPRDAPCIALLHTLPECDSPVYNLSPNAFSSCGLHECISYSWPADALSEHSVPPAQRHKDLEMAMGLYSDGYQSGIEIGNPRDCAVCSPLVSVQTPFKASFINGQKGVQTTCLTARWSPYQSDHLSIYTRTKILERSPPSIRCTLSDCSHTWLFKYGSLYTWIGGRKALELNALDEGCRRYRNATVFTMNENDPDLIAVDFGFGYDRAEESSREGRHDASRAASPALICLEEGPWQHARWACDSCDGKGRLARRLVEVQGFESMSMVGTLDMGRKDILEKRDSFNSYFSALEKRRVTFSAKAKSGNKDDKQVSQHFERFMEDASIQLKELDRCTGKQWTLNKPEASCQTLQHVHPVHRIQAVLEVYKLANDVARSLSGARRLTRESYSVSIKESTLQKPGLTHTHPSQEAYSVSIKESTLQKPGLTHTHPCIISELYDLGAYSTSSTFNVGWNSYRHDLLIDTACLLFGAIAGPPIQWVTLQSMHIGSNSLLDQKILQALPVSAKLVAALEPHQNIAIALMFSSTSMSVALLCKVAATTTGSGRSAVFICFWLAMVLGACAWNIIGGSAAEFFPVFMPVATTIGSSFGLYWQRR